MLMKTFAFGAALLIAGPYGLFAQSEELTGDWVSDCTPLGRHSVSATLSFSEEAVTTVAELLPDGACRETPNVRAEYDALFSLGERLADRGEIDLTPTRVEMTLLKPEVAAHYNQNEICGINDWQVGEPRQVAGRFCEPFQMPTLGTTMYDAYAAGSGELRFGGFPNQLAATQPEDRPVSLSGMFRFVRPDAR